MVSAQEFKSRRLVLYKLWYSRVKAATLLRRSLLSDSLGPHRLWPSRRLCLWNFPGKNTGVGCHSLLQGIFPNQGWNPGLLHSGRFFTIWATKAYPQMKKALYIQWLLFTEHLLSVRHFVNKLQSSLRWLRFATQLPKSEAPSDWPENHSKWQSWDLNPGWSDSKVYTISISRFILHLLLCPLPVKRSSALFYFPYSISQHCPTAYCVPLKIWDDQGMNNKGQEDQLPECCTI